MNNNEILERYKKDGYFHLKNVFSKDEIANFRNTIIGLHEGNLPCEVLTYESLRNIILDDRVLMPFRTILGEQLVYFGDSTIRNEVTDGFRSFHRDSQLDFEDPTKSVYPIARMGLYMQDHLNNSGGLKLRKGSHRHE